MSRGTAVILANTVFEIDNRVRKEAESLTAAGFDVVRVGLVRSASDLESESTEFGQIVRVRKFRGPRAATGTESVEGGSAHNAPAASVRVRKRGALSGFIRGIAVHPGPINDLLNYFVPREENRRIFGRALEFEPVVVVAVDLKTLRAGVWLKRETGAFLVYDCLELAVEQSGQWSQFRRWLFRRLERRLLREADLITTVGPMLARELSMLHGTKEPEVVFLGPSECTSVPSPIHSPVRILFQGAFATNRGLMPLVEGMARLRGKAVLTLQGFGAMERQLREVVAEGGLEDVVEFVEPCRPEDVVMSAREYDIGVIPYPLTTKHLAVTTPNKLMDYLGAGLAIATVDAPGITSVVDITTCGVAFDASDPNQMFDALEQLVSDSERVLAAKKESAALGARFLWPDQWRVIGDAIDTALAERAKQ